MLIANKLSDGACCSLSGIPFIVMAPDHRFDPLGIMIVSRTQS